MSSLKLPAEIISLVHHVELNKAGWWDKGSQRLILAALWCSGGTSAPNSIRQCLSDDFRLNIDQATFAKHVRALLGQHCLVELPNGDLKILETAQADFEHIIREGEELEARVKARFIMMLREVSREIDYEDAWRRFNDTFLLPLLRQTGARTYQLITGTTSQNTELEGTEAFLSPFPPELRIPIRSMMVSFLNPKDEVTRSYVLRNLNAYFFLEAGNLDPRTIESLAKITKQSPRFSVFVDTNFLFSILELHENPSNDAAKLLMRLTSELRSQVPVKFYASLVTLDETKSSVAFHKEMLTGLELEPNLAAAAIEDDLGGVARRFIEVAAKSKVRLTPETYFAPYLRDLITVLKAKGVEVFNEKMEGYSTREDVVDDITSQLAFEKKRYKEKAKSYERLAHDVILWHFARDKRPGKVESPLEARFWIVTLDYRLLGFDSFKTRSVQEEVPICLHPLSLIQMLQFWLPRTAEFEEAMLGTLRWPFLIQEFDRDAERITIQILKALSRFEDVGDLPHEVINSILVNEALRGKISPKGDIAEGIDLVKEAIIQESGKMKAQLDDRERDVDRLKAELAQKSEHVSELQDHSERQKSQIAETRTRLEEEQSARADLEGRLRSIEEVIESSKRSSAAARDIRSLLVRSSAAALLLAIAAMAATQELKNHGRPWQLAPISWALAGYGWIWFTDFSGNRLPNAKDWLPCRLLHRFRGWLWAVLGALILGAASGALWEWLKPLF